MIASTTLRRALVVFTTAAATSSLPAVAFADPAQPHGEITRGQDYTESLEGNHQRVVFKDEPVDGAIGGPAAARIVIRPNAARPGLVTPRVSFVQEMLKSVEKI